MLGVSNVGSELKGQAVSGPRSSQTEEDGEVEEEEERTVGRS